MYEAFYGLNEKPFNLTPDPRFLYLSPKHKEAFAHLLYGIQSRCGFVMVSGEIGTGKTTICRSLLRELDSNTDVAYIFNPRLSPEDLLRTINEDFGIDSVAESIRGLIDELNDYLLRRAGEGKNCVLIIDEAQNLDTETLEQVRLLSNLETETEKLLQIVLIGQPELPEKLKLPELRQLDQRITARYHLTTLNQPETLNYIAFRLRIAGGRKRVRFTRGAVRLIYKISGGTPRVINAICDRALLIGYTKETREITPPLVKQAAREVRGDDRIGKSALRMNKLLPATAFVAVSIALLAGVVMLTSGPLPTLGDAGSFARSQWERVVGLVETLPRDDSGSDDTQGRGDGPQEVEGPDFVAAAKASQPRDVSPEADPSPEAPSTAQPVKSSSPNVVEAASRNVAQVDGGPIAPPELYRAKGSEAKGAEKDMRRESREEKGVQGKHEGTKVAFSSILSAWDLAPRAELSNMETIEDVYGYAAANGLSFVRRTLSLQQVLTINLPFLAQLRGGGDERWVAVLSVESGAVTISTGNAESETLALEEFDLSFTREAVYIWSNPEADALALRARSGGSAVWELQDDLRSLGLSSREPTGVYDAATIEVVSKIQRATGLLVDGIVGPQTRMVLGNWLQAFPVAALKEPAFSEEARSRVLSSAGMVLASQPTSAASPQAGTAAASVERPAGFSEETGPAPSPPPLDSNVDIGDEQNDVSSEEPPADLQEEGGESTDPGEAELQAQVEEIVYEGGGTVSIERLDLPGYRPQLELDTAVPEDNVTQSAGPIVPIVPSDLRLGER